MQVAYDFQLSLLKGGSEIRKIFHNIILDDIISKNLIRVNAKTFRYILVQKQNKKKFVITFMSSKNLINFTLTA